MLYCEVISEARRLPLRDQLRLVEELCATFAWPNNPRLDTDGAGSGRSAKCVVR